jgi:hypothetical protein
LSRRAFFGIGGSTLLVVASATAWRRRRSRAGTAPRDAAPIPYADHDGWMVSVTEKRALQARTGDSPGAPR